MREREEIVIRNFPFQLCKLRKKIIYWKAAERNLQIQKQKGDQDEKDKRYCFNKLG